MQITLLSFHVLFSIRFFCGSKVQEGEFACKLDFFENG